ncbi:M-phase phosphoprotein 9 isoform X2 [Ambystoma mexicanum]|uniref:M-phase phosphoprotein 9 isoform X2 n=1 Tax=Ambystoma mexicanum TaxID=8296 RepID=UPI0037E86CB4
MHVEEEARGEERAPLSFNHEAGLETEYGGVSFSSTEAHLADQLVIKMEDAGSRKTRDTRQPPIESTDAVILKECTSPAESPESMRGTCVRTCVSGNASSPVFPSSVELLTTFMQDMHKSGMSKTEIWKNCEARWVKIFNLVEKQCQEQIAAQQEQFHQQIQLIQDEIKHLVTLQSSKSPCRSSAGDSSIKLASNMTVWGMPAGQHSGSFEGNKAIANQCSSSCESGVGEKMQESFDDSISATSGYGTMSLPQPNLEKVQVGHGLAPAVNTSKEHGSTGFRLTFDKCENMHATGKDGWTLQPSQANSNPLAQEAQATSVSSEADEANEGEPSNRKPLTSWARKVKQSQLKKPASEKETCDNSMPRTEQTEKLKHKNMSSMPSEMFLLGRQSDSPSSVFSEGSGLSYWKQDEKEMYHSLPGSFERGLSNMFTNNLATQQPNSVSDGKLQSLKGIYQSKQRENNERPAWSPPDQSHQTHPPEVWTLDPTIHMKPGQQNPEPPFHNFVHPMGAKIPFTPDSFLESSSCSRSDGESVSNGSNRYSPTLGGSPNIFPRSRFSHLDLKGNSTFQSETNANTNFVMRFDGSDFPPNQSVIQVEDDKSSCTLTPPSATRSPSHCGDDHESDYNCFSSLEHPAMLSRIKQHLREKHARHIADLRDYYESEINHLKQQLDASNTSKATEEMRKTNQILVARCDQLENALTQASTRLRTLENKNNSLEMQVVDWRERFHAVTSTSSVLQGRVEEMRASNKEKENTISRLESRLKDLEDAFQKSCKLSEEKDGIIKQEQKRFQDLLADYESLGKEHERVKDTLSSAESRQTDANREISELKRTISKLEAQIKQMEQENMAKLRHIAEDHIRITNAKLRNADVNRRKWLLPGSECSLFTGQPLEKEKIMLDNRLQESYLPKRYPSPPEKEVSRESFSRSLTKKERMTPDTPIMRAFKEFEDGKVFKSWGTQTEKVDISNKALNRRSFVGFVDSACGVGESPERNNDQKRTKRLSSPHGQRSSSLPPSNRRSHQSATPTKREIMLMPVSVKYSPKRSPKENFSPGLSQLLNNEGCATRFDVLLDDLHSSPPSFQGRSPRKKLQFISHGDPGALDHIRIRTEMDTCGTAYEENTPVLEKDICRPVSVAAYEPEFTYKTEVKTLGETERLFDELTQEKQQIEAALSRVPCSGGRMTLQARCNKEALEDRLEKINRDLGSIRMTLKKFHVLRTSANI